MKNIINSFRSPSRSSKRSFIRGFTLIEMMVVIAIIAILTAIIITNLSGAKGKARDAKRISDLGNIQLALELIYDRCNEYPVSNAGQIDSGTVCTKNGHDYTMSDFIASIPIPSNETNQNHYNYFTTAAGRNSYVLVALLESPNAAVTDGLNDSNTYSGGTVTIDSRSTVPSWMQYFAGVYPVNGQQCSNLPTSKVYCIGPR